MFPQEAKGSQHVSQIALCVIVITCNSERHVAFGVRVSLPANSRPFPQAPLSPVRSGTRHTPAGALCRPSEALAQARAIGGDYEARGPLDRHLKSGRLHDRQISGLLPLENSTSVNTDLTITVSKAHSVTDQATRRERGLHPSGMMVCTDPLPNERVPTSAGAAAGNAVDWVSG
jgi:hypothetical protein